MLWGYICVINNKKLREFLICLILIIDDFFIFLLMYIKLYVIFDLLKIK